MAEFLASLGYTQLAWVVVIGLFLFVAFLAWRDKAMAAQIAPEPGRLPASARFLLIILGGAFFVGMLVWIFQPGASSVAGFGSVAGLILIGMAAFIGIMSILSRTAARVGMLDGRQPFGLPDGSVRAILTMAFIVLVGVLTAFLITSHQNRSLYQSEGILIAPKLTETKAQEQAETLNRKFGTDAFVAIQETKADPKPTPVTYELYLYSKIDNQMADDIAKQTLTMISTILAAMIGFYFAARSNTEGADPAVARRAEARAKLSELVATGGVRERLDAAKDAIEKRRASLPPPGDAARKKQDDILTNLQSQFEAYNRRFSAARITLENASATLGDIDGAHDDLVRLKDDFGKIEMDLKTGGGPDPDAAKRKQIQEDLEKLLSDDRSALDAAGRAATERRGKLVSVAAADKPAEETRLDEADRKVSAFRKRIDDASVTNKNDKASLNDLQNAQHDLTALKSEIEKLNQSLKP